MQLARAMSRFKVFRKKVIVLLVVVEAKHERMTNRHDSSQLKLSLQIQNSRIFREKSRKIRGKVLSFRLQVQERFLSHISPDYARLQLSVSKNNLKINIEREIMSVAIPFLPPGHLDLPLQTANAGNQSFVQINSRLIIFGSLYTGTALQDIQHYLAENVSNVNYFRIYNFSDESDYNIEQDLPNVLNIPLIAGVPCSIEQLIQIITNMDTFLTTDPQNIILVHSKRGCNRANFIAGCLLLHSFSSSKISVSQIIENLQLQRTQQLTLSSSSSSSILTIPSYIRYLYYYDHLLRCDLLYTMSYRLKAVKLHGIPRCSTSILNPTCTPVLVIYSIQSNNPTNNNNSLLSGTQSASSNNNNIITNMSHQFQILYHSQLPSDLSLFTDMSTSSLPTSTSSLATRVLDSLPTFSSQHQENMEWQFLSPTNSNNNMVINREVILRNDIVMVLYHAQIAPPTSLSHATTTINNNNNMIEYTKILQCCFHTSFCSQSHIYYEKELIDIVHQDTPHTSYYHSMYPTHCALEITLEEMDDSPIHYQQQYETMQQLIISHQQHLHSINNHHTTMSGEIMNINILDLYAGLKNDDVRIEY
jgi:hypothetical protein